METNKKPSPFAVLWGWAERYHGGFYISVALAVLRVAARWRLISASPLLSVCGLRSAD